MKNETKLLNNKDERLSELLENWGNIPEESRISAMEKISSLIEQKNYPVYVNNSKVILFYNNAARVVKLLSDITGWTDPIPFIKMNNSLFFLLLELEPDARIQYHLIVDDKVICDPLNKYKALHGLGALSELAMPEYARHPYLNDYLYGREGSYEGLIKHVLPSEFLRYEHEVFVYLPPDYDRNKKYPAVYFHDGPDYIRYGLAPHSISKLIAEKKIKPCMAVFVTPPNLHQPAFPNRSTEYGMNDNYVKFFCDELVGFIDAEYSTIKSPDKRVVAGDSYAGLISIYIVMSRPDKFKAACSQSGYFSFSNDKLINLINSMQKKPIRLYIDTGTYEKKVGADFLPSTELDFTNANRRMRDALLKKDYDFIYREYHEGHTWGNWRRHLIDALIYFFGYHKEEIQ